MNRDEINRRIKFSKVRGELRSEAKISECFHFNKDECKGKIKNVHSIQRNGRLSLLEEEVNGNMNVYSFEIEPVGTKEYQLKPVGIASASAFTGFCDFHDTTLFSTIENQPFQEENDEHCFLHSYRAFAIAHHRKKEQSKAFKADIEFNRAKQDVIPEFLKGTDVGYNEGEMVRTRLNDVLRRKAYEELEYLEIRYSNLYPLASSSAMTPTHTPKTNTRLNIHQEVSVPYEYVFLT